MAFGLAEILTDGWLQMDEYVFGLRETAVTVAMAWIRLKNMPKIGVVDTEQRKLVWRSDRGVLGLPCLNRSSEPSR